MSHKKIRFSYLATKVPFSNRLNVVGKNFLWIALLTSLLPVLLTAQQSAQPPPPASSSQTNAPPSPRAQKANTPIRYSADRVIAKPNDDKFYLFGNATIFQNESKLRADNIQIDNQQSLVTATGNVRFENPTRDIYYKGRKIVYNTETETILGEDRPTISRKIDPMTFRANKVEVFLERDLINFSGNLDIRNNSAENNELKISGRSGFFNTKENIFQVIGNPNNSDIRKGGVKITETRTSISNPRSAKNDAENQPGILNGGIVYCRKMLFYSDIQKINCQEEAIFENRKENELLTASRFEYEQAAEIASAFGNVRYEKTNKDRTDILESDRIHFYQKKGELSIIGNVSFQSINNETKKVLYAGKCQEATLINTDKENKKNLTCKNDVVINDYQNSIVAYGQLFVYDEATELGSLSKDASVVSQQDNPIVTHAEKIDFDNKLKVATMNQKVLIEQKNTESDTVTGTIKCDNGKFFYGREQEEIENIANVDKGIIDHEKKYSNLFTCKKNVAINQPEDNLNLFGDELVYYTRPEIGELRGNIRFSARTKQSKARRNSRPDGYLWQGQ